MADTLREVDEAAAARLVLWDIDQTLVDLTGLGHDWYRHALRTVAGVSMRALPTCAGRTELAITTDILAEHDLEVNDDSIARVWDELITISERASPTLAARGRALPGTEVALSTVAGHGHIVQSVVTGNLPEIARVKLSAFGLHEYLDFEVGGYGSLSAERHALVGHAITSASSKYAMRLAPERVTVVGDTPADIIGAVRHGATAVGVATGHYTERELLDAGASAVLPDLSDLDDVRAAVFGSP